MPTTRTLAAVLASACLLLGCGDNDTGSADESGDVDTQIQDSESGDGSSTGDADGTDDGDEGSVEDGDTGNDGTGDSSGNDGDVESGSGDG